VFTHIIHSDQNKYITLLTYFRILTGFFQNPITISVIVIITGCFIAYTCKAFGDQYEEKEDENDVMKKVKVKRCNEVRTIGIHEVLPTDIVEITDDITIAPFDMVLTEGELYV
jgi:magnesium-transporting ATPase (P-type)